MTTSVREHLLRQAGVISLPQAPARWERARPGSGIALIDQAKQTRAVRQEELQRAFARHTGCWAARPSARCWCAPGTGRSPSSSASRSLSSVEPGPPASPRTLTVRLSDGLAGEIDIAFPGRRIAIELDGYAFHPVAAAFRKDVRRGNRLMSDGWTVRRFPWDDLVGDPDAFIAVVCELLCG